MDMTLYALLMSKLNGQDECTTWNGFRIEIVNADEIPEVPLPNTIYFVKSTVQLKEEVVDENENRIVGSDV